MESDYHVEVDGHSYSIPHGLVGQVVEARATATTVEILRRGLGVAAHVRSYAQGKKTTVPDHLPVAHRKHLEWTPERIGAWANEIGPSTSTLTTAILRDRPHGCGSGRERHGVDGREIASRGADDPGWWIHGEPLA